MSDENIADARNCLVTGGDKNEMDISNLTPEQRERFLQQCNGLWPDDSWLTDPNWLARWLKIRDSLSLSALERLSQAFKAGK